MTNGNGSDHPERATPMVPSSLLPVVFELLARVAKAVAVTVGPNCEVVVHDLRDPEHTVVAISGNLTHRSIGAPAPDPSVLPDRVDQFEADTLLERLTTLAGKELLSSTVWIRDETRHIVGAFCINMDFADLRLARDLINRHMAEEPSAAVSPLGGQLGFATTAEEFAEIALRGILREIGKPLHHLDREDKVLIVRELDQAGVFNLRGAAETVARELGVSRASVYSYLNASRSEAAAAASD
jgi:predicted transcriptional regulator YheO